MITKEIPLKKTVELMTSNDYVDRFVAEYLQTKIRYEKLKALVTKLHAGKLKFRPYCPEWLLEKQQHIMGEYLGVLELRAEYEDIPLISMIADVFDKRKVCEFSIVDCEHSENDFEPDRCTNDDK